MIGGLKDPLLKKNIYNNQVWQLAHGYAHLDRRSIASFSDDELLTLAIAHIDELNFVGITENLRWDGPKIFQFLRSHTSTPFTLLNATPERKPLHYHSQRVLSHLQSLTHLDWQLYNYVLRKRHIVL